MAEETAPATPHLSKREIARLGKPFLAKEADLDIRALSVMCDDWDHGLLFEHPEVAVNLAEQLGFNKLFNPRRPEVITPPLDRDPRQIFESMAYDHDKGVYTPSGMFVLTQIVCNGMERSAAELILKSIFHPSARFNFPNLNANLRMHSWIVNSERLPKWVKEIEWLKPQA